MKPSLYRLYYHLLGVNMSNSNARWKLIDEYPIGEYQCGARAGDRVRLRRDIVTQDHQGKPTGEVYRAGEVWMVLCGSAEPPVDVWLRQADGETHTWSDDGDFWIQFERLEETVG